MSDDEGRDLIIECSVCEKKLRIPATSKGKRFRCPGCKEIIEAPPPPEEEEDIPEVPQAEPARESREASEEGPPSKARKGRKKSSAPAGTGKGHARRKKSSKARSRTPKEGGEKSGGSKAWLGAAALGLIVLVAVVGAVLVFGSKEEPPPNPSGDGETSQDPDNDSGSPAVERPKPPPTLSPEAQARLEKETALLHEALCAGSPEQYHTVAMKALEGGHADFAARLFSLAVERNQADQLDGLSGGALNDACEKAGWKQYELPPTEKELSKEEGVLDFHKARDGKWLPPAQYEWVKRLETTEFKRAREESARRKNDPVYAKVQKLKKMMRGSRGFSDIIFGHRYDAPYLVLDERGRRGERLDDADEIEFLTEKKVQMLRQVFTFVKKTWMDPLGIKLKNLEPMVAIQFKDHSSFRKYNEAIGMFLPPGVAAYYNRVSTFIYMYDSPAQTPEALDQQDGILFHEATHQIVSFFLNETGRTMFGAVPITHWFSEGNAEYVGSCTRSEEAEERTWLFGVENPSRIDEFYHALHPDKHRRFRDTLKIKKPFALSLKEMADCRGKGKVVQIVKRRIGPYAPQHDKTITGIASSLIYAQASIFFHLCLRGPKKDDYGPRLLKYAAQEFKGRGGWLSLEKAFEGIDMTQLEREWYEHLEKMTPDRTKRGT